MKIRRFFISTDELSNKLITNSELHHATKVLRLKEGDQIVVFVNDDFDYLAEITYISNFGISFDIIKRTPCLANPEIDITVFQALVKSDKLELIIQKSTELGATKLIPYTSKYCDVRQKSSIKYERLNKIIINACKQCGRSKLMSVGQLEKLEDICTLFKDFDLVLFANETENSNSITKSFYKTRPLKKIALIVGPEGGFDTTEITKIINTGAVSVSLGRRILRTETAGMYMLSVISELTRN